MYILGRDNGPKTELNIYLLKLTVKYVVMCRLVCMNVSIGNTYVD